MKGRTIALQIRTIEDITLLAEEKDVEGIVTSLDFQKAFDSVEKETILYTLNLFNLGGSILI